jgi:hypothetical protein
MGEMSILDDAIREHLELKRQHGADETELKKLEDEAFGPPSRDEPDPLAEAPTAFMDAESELGAPAESGGRRAPNIADLQEPPPPPPPAEVEDDASAEPPDATAEQEAAEHKLPVPAAEELPAAPDAGLQPDPDAPREPSAEQRQTASDQPTEMFDVEGTFDDTAESASPADEALLAAEQGEPRVTGPVADEPEDEFDDFFSDQRLSDELTRALDEPFADEPSLPSTEEALAGLPPRTDEHEVPRTDEHDAPASFEEPSEEAMAPFTEETEPPQTDESDFPATGEAELPFDQTVEHDLPEPDSAEEDLPGSEDKPGHEDVLEDTPEFLEDSPEDENAWFEQRPPKDFDFDD